MTAFLITTRIRATICGRCRQPIFTGDAEGLRTRVDITPLTRQGEIVAIIAGRATYVLHRNELIYRNSYRIQDDRISGPLLITHQCGNQMPPEYRPPPETNAVPVTATAVERIPY